MNDLKDRIREIMRRTSKDDPITKQELLVALDLDQGHERIVRRVITEELMEEMPIGSHSNGNQGYFLIGPTTAELEGPDVEDRARALRILERMKRRRKAWENYYDRTGDEVIQLNLGIIDDPAGEARHAVHP